MPRPFEQPLARVITRMVGEGDGLILGTVLKGGEKVLKPNSIYELIRCELTGDLKLMYRSESMVACGENETIGSSPLGVCWSLEYAAVLTKAAPELWLTPVEYIEVLKKRIATEEASEDPRDGVIRHAKGAIEHTLGQHEARRFTRSPL